jgi:indolepyruvate ferredoxin oxidoreductase
LPEPELPRIDHTYNIIVTGVGGTGIVTIGGILGMAAHLEGKATGVIDMAGLAQKGGAVYSHMRIAERPEDIHAIRVAAGGAHLVLGGDIVVAGNKKVLAAVQDGKTAMVINTSEFMPGDFTRNADFSLPTERLRRAITGSAGQDSRGHPLTHFVDASRLATALFGSSLGANIFMVGFAYQLGALPLSAASIEQAIALNGEAVPMNLAAFHWGRRAALDLEAVESIARAAPETRDENRELSQSFEEMVARRVKFLTAYQSRRYAKRYRKWAQKAKDVESERVPSKSGLADAVARYLYKLMAYKDEYEVARLYTDGTFRKQVANDLGGEKLRFEFHLAPPLFAKTDPATGEPRKISFGPWMMSAFKVLAAFRFLRGTPLDIFGRTAERQTERKLIAEYQALLKEILDNLTVDNHALAVGLVSIPEKIRGYGPVKARHLKAAKADEAALLEQFRAGTAPMLKAAE